MTGHDIDQDDLAAKRLNDLAADYFLTGIVAALDQDRRPDAADQLFRRIFIEYGNQIDGFERSENFGTRLHRLHRPPCPLQTRDGIVPVETHNETIAGRTRAGQKLDVTRVKQIEAAVGKTNAQALLAPLGKMLVKNRPVEDNFLFRR